MVLGILSLFGSTLGFGLLGFRNLLLIDSTVT